MCTLLNRAGISSSLILIIIRNTFRNRMCAAVCVGIYFAPATPDERPKGLVTLCLSIAFAFGLDGGGEMGNGGSVRRQRKCEGMKKRNEMTAKATFHFHLLLFIDGRVFIQRTMFAIFRHRGLFASISPSAACVCVCRCSLRNDKKIFLGRIVCISVADHVRILCITLSVILCNFFICRSPSPPHRFRHLPRWVCAAAQRAQRRENR